MNTSPMSRSAGDTALRTQVIWQVKLLPLAPLIASGALTSPPMCKSFPAGWVPNGQIRLQLRARAFQTQAATSPCELPAEGGYRSLENHLYRVEIHRGGVQGTNPIFVKWSRDNAIHRTRVLDVADGSLVVEEIGKDDVTALATDDWVGTARAKAASCAASPVSSWKSARWWACGSASALFSIPSPLRR